MKHCIDCGHPNTPLFIWVSNNLWEELGLHPEDFVCDHCLIDRIKEIRTYVYLSSSEGGISCNGTEMVIYEHKFYGDRKTIDKLNKDQYGRST